VDYLKPTPLGPPIYLRATVAEIKGRKTIVLATVSVDNIVTAKGRVVAVRMPDRLREEGRE
jgi:tRNA A37 threonylcarbamoyladenosine synthetase subunit TsaC/SUA5/YrdC